MDLDVFVLANWFMSTEEFLDPPSSGKLDELHGSENNLVKAKSGEGRNGYYTQYSIDPGIKSSCGSEYNN